MFSRAFENTPTDTESRVKLVPRLDAAKLNTVPDVFEVLYLFAVPKMDAFIELESMVSAERKVDLCTLTCEPALPSELVYRVSVLSLDVSPLNRVSVLVG